MEKLFKETQKFRQWWLWLIIVGASVLAVGIPFIYGEPTKITIGVVLSILLFYSIKLKTEIKEDGIYYQFFPFHLQMKHIAWERLEQCHVRKYNPLREFGGWGIRFGWSGKAYNVSGDMGLQLEFKSGKKLLIGTQKAAEIQIILDDIQLDRDLQKANV